MAILTVACLTLLTACGLAYLLLALVAIRSFVRGVRTRSPEAGFAPPVTLLKPLKGLDARLDAALRSHCEQVYPGEFEILFGVSSPDDPAVAEVRSLQADFPHLPLRLIVCPERLGSSGKVSNLLQMLSEARHPFVLINDSDIAVSPEYLARVMRVFADPAVGMVTAPYRGYTVPLARGLTLWSRIEALGISTDFFPGILTARLLEGGLRFGLGSTLAVRREALERAGGLEPLLEHLADDYEMGARISRAGYRVELSEEIVETAVPPYTLRGFVDHQLRWARSTRDSRKLGYLGLGVTFCLPWALLTVLASGFALWSFSLLSLALLVRVAVALAAGVGVLRDGQVLRDLLLLPLRDLLGFFFWIWSFASDTVVWRGERFHLRDGRLSRVT